jgi:hypothetical protein
LPAQRSAGSAETEVGAFGTYSDTFAEVGGAEGVAVHLALPVGGLGFSRRPEMGRTARGALKDP